VESRILITPRKMNVFAAATVMGFYWSVPGAYVTVWRGLMPAE